MYKVSQGQSRIINRTRRDLTQKLESLDQIRELTRKSLGLGEEDAAASAADHCCTMSSPRPVFHQTAGSNKGGRSSNGRAHVQDITPQHEELIRFFNDSWGRVCKELEMARQNGHDARGSGSSISYYQEKSEHPALRGFKPFDLESWWGSRTYANLTQSTKIHN